MQIFSMALINIKSFPFFPPQKKFSGKFLTYIKRYFKIKFFFEKLLYELITKYKRTEQQFSLSELTVMLGQAAEPNFTAVSSIYNNNT